ncbi:unnamed protein product [Cylindrotheca closterium]|uniref:Uncharacterized protein n=1 Tax=Cylindrotheca closterium TaxID=2856 RepID=A0AAD2G932_9STRA|nr:unnamed protein product [Cylindrotheca closterium]
MSYKQNAASDRDALFGNSGNSSKAKKSSKAKLAAHSAAAKNPKTSMGYQYRSKEKKTPMKPGLVGEEKAAKLKEAKALQDKAKKCLRKGLFSKPDPLSASTYFKRAADDFQKCGEFRLERFNRMDNADCQLQVGAYATAALEFTRAAELIVDDPNESFEAKQQVSRELHLKSSEAWRNANERAKAAASQVKAALTLIDGDESRALSGDVVMAIEEAIEAHVPDPLNPYSRYRQTGISVFITADSGETAQNPSLETLELAKQQIVTEAYAHESVQEVVYLLVSYDEFASALYCAGAATTLLSEGGVATLSLSRAFLTETILTLAMGDPIAAEENFLQRHVQKSSYLTSRECKFAEELFRAVKSRDDEQLDEVRSSKGTNRAAIGNLHECLRVLVGMIQTNGTARKVTTKDSSSKKAERKRSPKSSQSSKNDSSKKSEPKRTLKDSDASNNIGSDDWADLSSAKTGYERQVQDGDPIDEDALQNELDGLDFGDDDSSADDDSVDLR